MSSLRSLDVAEYIGLPFRTHGRDRGGCDCWGLVRIVYRERLGVELPDLGETYGDALTDCAAIADLIARERPMWHPIERGQELPGDLVTLRLKRVECHVGVVVSRPLMLHSEADKIAACCERYDVPLYARRVTGFYRHAQLV